MNDSSAPDSHAPVSHEAVSHEPVHVDCDRCIVRSPGACGDCVVTVLLGAPPAGIDLDADDVAALEALADGGLVPPLRLVIPLDPPDTHAVGS